MIQRDTLINYDDTYEDISEPDFENSSDQLRFDHKTVVNPRKLSLESIKGFHDLNLNDNVDKPITHGDENLTYGIPRPTNNPVSIKQLRYREMESDLMDFTYRDD